jgi:hypothetical protein
LVAPVRWAADSVAYEAKTLHYAGASERAAEHRAFLLEPQVAAADGRSGIDTQAKFAASMIWYRRRVLVPAVAAKLQPVLGVRSLQAVSVAGFVLVGLALYGFLRLRFSPVLALGGSTSALAFPPFQHWSFYPLVDSVGVLFVVMALTLAVLTLRRGYCWLFPWMLVLVAGSLTRETIAAPVIAAFMLVVWRVRRALPLFVTGVGAVAPAMFFLRFPFAEAFARVTAYQLRVPIDTSFSALLSHWLFLTAVLPVRDVLAEPIWAPILAIPVAFVLRMHDGSTNGKVVRAAAIAGLVYLASFPFVTNLRLELVLLPAAAYGVALLAESAFAPGRIAFVRPFDRQQRERPAEALSAMTGDPTGRAR